METQLLGSGILNFGPCAARGHPEFNPVGRDDGVLIYGTAKSLEGLDY